MARLTVKRQRPATAPAAGVTVTLARCTVLALVIDTASMVLVPTSLPAAFSHWMIA